MVEESQTKARLRSFLSELTPTWRASLFDMLNRQSEGDLTSRDVILTVLYEVMQSVGESKPRLNSRDALLAPVAPFTVREETKERMPGTLPKHTLDRLWLWLTRDGAKDLIENFEQTLCKELDENRLRHLVDSTQDAILNQVNQYLAGLDDIPRGRQRFLGQIGGEEMEGALKELLTILKRRKLIASISQDIEEIGRLDPEDVFPAAKSRIGLVASKLPDVFPYAIIAMRNMLGSPQTFVRFVAFCAEGPEERKIIKSTYAYAIDLIIAEAERAYVQTITSQEKTDSVSLNTAIKHFGAIVRALSMETELSPTGEWGKRIGVLRTAIGKLIYSRLVDLTKRVKEVVYLRPDDPFPADLSPMEVAHLVSDVAMLVAAKPYAEEIALNALTNKTYKDVRELVEAGSEILVDQLRTASGKYKKDLKSRLKIVVRFCNFIFGAEFTGLLIKSIEIAGQETSTAQHAQG